MQCCTWLIMRCCAERISNADRIRILDRMQYRRHLLYIGHIGTNVKLVSRAAINCNETIPWVKWCNCWQATNCKLTNSNIHMIARNANGITFAVSLLQKDYFNRIVISHWKNNPTDKYVPENNQELGSSMLFEKKDFWFFFIFVKSKGTANLLKSKDK